jgi:hypothetical protein
MPLNREQLEKLKTKVDALDDPSLAGLKGILKSLSRSTTDSELDNFSNQAVLALSRLRSKETLDDLLEQMGTDEKTLIIMVQEANDKSAVREAKAAVSARDVKSNTNVQPSLPENPGKDEAERYVKYFYDNRKTIDFPSLDSSVWKNIYKAAILSPNAAEYVVGSRIGEWFRGSQDLLNIINTVPNKKWQCSAIVYGYLRKNHNIDDSRISLLQALDAKSSAARKVSAAVADVYKQPVTPIIAKLPDSVQAAVDLLRVTNPYELLGVDDKADAGAIDQAWKAKHAEGNFHQLQLINAAKVVLKNPQARSQLIFTAPKSSEEIERICKGLRGKVQGVMVVIVREVLKVSKDPYKILGVERDASSVQIEAARSRANQKIDANEIAPAEKDKAKDLVRRAAKILLDPEARRIFTSEQQPAPQPQRRLTPH